jgi:hypothetical protein
MKGLMCVLVLSVALVGCKRQKMAPPPETTSEVRTKSPIDSVGIASEEMIVHLGSFSNMEFTEEHQYGSEVRLWKKGGEVIGQFSHSDGLIGETPTGVIENVNYDEKTGAMSFEAKLTTGQHSCKEHSDVPSRDLFQFNGTLGKESLSGILRQLDALHNNELLGEERKVDMKRTNRTLPDQTYKQWKEKTAQVLSSYGPKW